jgi:hypothetical protein
MRFGDTSSDRHIHIDTFHLAYESCKVYEHIAYCATTIDIDL